MMTLMVLFLSLFHFKAPVSFTLPSDVFEDDILSCSSASPEQLGNRRSPSLSSSPGLSSDHLLSDGSPVSTPNNHSPSSVQVKRPLRSLNHLVAGINDTRIPPDGCRKSITITDPKRSGTCFFLSSVGLGKLSCCFSGTAGSKNGISQTQAT